MDVNVLQDTVDKAGAKVQELENKRQEMSVKLVANPEAYSDEEITKMSNDLAKAKKVRDIAQATLRDARANMKAPVSKSEKSVAHKKAEEIRDAFVKDFTNMVTSGVLPEGSQTTGPNAGLTIPVDVQTAIHELVRSFNSLEGIVNVENVTVPSGTRVYEKIKDITPLANLDDETAAIGDNDDPELTLIKYAIKRYAGITTVTNTLLADTAENIMSWLMNWAAKKDVITRNTEILKVINEGKNGKTPKKATITKFDDVKDMSNNTLDPLIENSSTWITNQSGYNILSKLKDANGDYLLQPDVTQPDRKLIDGKPVQVIADKWLPDISGNHPLYFGDFKQAITLFDRQKMQVVSTNIGAGAFEHDLTKIRFIDRFDVELIDDGAYVVGSFKKVTDQVKQVADTDGTSTNK
ncbi:phage major capsid protein [Lactobacillus intestinalis]|uniref:phage major capsid protein n=1 Tax=Lactobacillus intestinalis TaxID=151781 RepID=UPI0025A9957A|nr:phage major capsid protein [Lactobacillus intestinalis]